MMGLPPATVVLVFVAFYRLSTTIINTPIDVAIMFLGASVSLSIQDEPNLPSRSVVVVVVVVVVR